MNETGGSGTEVAAIWGAVGVIVAAALTQIGLFLKARRQTRRNPRHNAEAFLESKDARAFKVITDRLTATEDECRECQAQNERLRDKLATLMRNFSMALYSIDVLRGCLEGAGIKVPTLPKIENIA